MPCLVNNFNHQIYRYFLWLAFLLIQFVDNFSKIPMHLQNINGPIVQSLWKLCVLSNSTPESKCCAHCKLKWRYTLYVHTVVENHCDSKDDLKTYLNKQISNQLDVTEIWKIFWILMYRQIKKKGSSSLLWSRFFFLYVKVS